MKQIVSVFLCCVTCIVIVFFGSKTIKDVVLVGSKTIKEKPRANDIVMVTGLASRDFDSDIIVWEGDFKRNHSELKNAYQELEEDRKKVEEFLISQGVKKDEIIFSSIGIEKSFKDLFNAEGNKIGSEFVAYNLSQSVRIESAEVSKIENASREITQLINQGIELYSKSPEYYYSKLSNLKIEMVAEATKDARIRAEQIVENAKGKLGGLRYSNLGVFQIVAPNSNEEISWDGAMNRSSKKKTAMVTVKLQFGLE